MAFFYRTIVYQTGHSRLWKESRMGRLRQFMLGVYFLKKACSVGTEQAIKTKRKTNSLAGIYPFNLTSISFNLPRRFTFIFSKSPTFDSPITAIKSGTFFISWLLTRTMTSSGSNPAN